jgi:galactokinase
MEQVQLTVEDIRDRFQMKFKGAVGNVYAAPGRINLIGEHTDGCTINLVKKELYDAFIETAKNQLQLSQ